MDNEIDENIDSEKVVIGTIIQSMLGQKQFKEQHGGRFVLMDGRNVSGSDYETLTGNDTVPDYRGLFFRTFGDRSADLGEIQEQSVNIGHLEFNNTFDKNINCEFSHNHKQLNQNYDDFSSKNPKNIGANQTGASFCEDGPDAERYCFYGLRESTIPADHGISTSGSSTAKIPTYGSVTADQVIRIADTDLRPNNIALNHYICIYEEEPPEKIDPHDDESHKPNTVEIATTGDATDDFRILPLT